MVLLSTIQKHSGVMVMSVRLPALLKLKFLDEKLTVTKQIEAFEK